MSAWAIKDATETWQDVCDRAWAGEPQFVTRGPSQTVVVISYVDYLPSVPKCQKVVNNQKQSFMINDKRLKIGSMKDEIHLPDNFDQVFEGLDDQVASMFAGVAS